MQVLSSPPVPLQAPIPLLPPSSRSSLLERNQPTQKFVSSLEHTSDLHPSFSSGPSGGAPLPAQMSALVHSDPSTTPSPVTVSATLRPPARKSNYPSSSFLPFVPLTPIMASPRLTPDLGSVSATGVVGVQVDERLSQYVINACSEVEQQNWGEHSRTSTGRDGEPDEEPDGDSSSLSSSALSVIANHDVLLATTSPSLGAPMTTPSWTSTPPTPPQKPLKSPRDSLDNESSPMRKKTSRSRLNHPRPASVAVFPELRAIMDAPQPATAAGWIPRLRHRTPSFSPENERCLERKVDYYLDEEGTRRIRRRQSLPSHFWKTQPPIPDPTSPFTYSLSPSSDSFNSEMQSLIRSPLHLLSPRSRPALRSVPSGDLVLYPNLSRLPQSLRTRSGSPLRATVVMREESSPPSSWSRIMSGDMTESQSADSFKTALESLSPSSSASSRQSMSAIEGDAQKVKGKRLFHLGDDGSDVEEGDRELENAGDDDTAEDVRGSPRSIEDVNGQQGQRGGVRETQGNMKRCHVLMELLSTEVGYLMDLRALVTIYLRQLPSLSIPIPSPALSRPSPSSLSISSLGLPRSFPSSRSFTQPNPVSSAGLGPPTPDSGQQDKDAAREKEQTKGDRVQRPTPTRRPILSEKEMGDITRNAEQLVKFHENFIQGLKSAVEPLGYGSAFIRSPLAVAPAPNFNGDMQRALENVEGAIRLVAEAFTHQAGSFQLYEGFCSGHNEAADLIRNVQENHPIEWDAYEQRCSLLVAHEFDLVATPEKAKREGSPLDLGVDGDGSESMRKKKRRHSTSSLAVPTLMSPLGLPSPTTSHLNMMVQTKSDPADDRRRKDSDGGAPQRIQSQIGRLKLLDYLIKPVQRICKYPLLLAQLRPKKRMMMTMEEGDGEDPVEVACEAMKVVCTLVDEASSRQAHLVKSALIVTRIMQALPSAPPISPLSSPQEEKSSCLTSEFLGSLGACLLAGALDVVYRPSLLRAKYLGAFLYVGGYLVLVKVVKNGKAYEPRYWFSLEGFELIDAEEDDAFPYSFHLWSAYHHLQLAAACQQEKEIWIAAIREATSSPASWTNEPVSSLYADDKGQTMSGTEDDHHDRATPLPTIQSLSDLETNSDGPSPPSPMLTAKALQRPYKTMSRYDGAGLRQEQPLSRRSSTASVKAFFTFETYPRIIRPSSQVRAQVEQGLGDVFSEGCVAVRVQAQKRDEELFQARKKSGIGMTRSSSGMNLVVKRRRHDSVLYSTHRRKNSAEGSILDGARDRDGSTNARNTLIKRNKSVTGKRRLKQQLSIVPSSDSSTIPPLPSGELEMEMTTSPEPILPDSPSPLSQCSSVTSSNPGSMLPSPLDASLPLPMPLPSLDTKNTLRQGGGTAGLARDGFRPKRTRSMVENVRYFFHSRSSSPVLSISNYGSNATGGSGSGSSGSGSGVDLECEGLGGMMMQWLRKGSLRRRVKSFPDVPGDESGLTSSRQSIDGDHGGGGGGGSVGLEVPPPQSQLQPQQDQGRVEREREDDGAIPTRESEPNRLLSSSPKRVAFMETMPTRRRSLFSSCSSPKKGQQERSISPAGEGSGSVPASPSSRMKLKGVLLFARSSSFSSSSDRVRHKQPSSSPVN